MLLCRLLLLLLISGLYFLSQRYFYAYLRVFVALGSRPKLDGLAWGQLPGSYLVTCHLYGKSKVTRRAPVCYLCDDLERDLYRFYG